MWSCCWGSLASALLFSLVTGGKINYSWVVPCFPFMGVWLFMAWSPRITRKKANAYLTAVLLMRHGNLSLSGAPADGVSPMTELTALYSARLLLNGAPLLVFAAADAVFRRKHPAKEREHHEDQTA